VVSRGALDVIPSYIAVSSIKDVVDSRQQRRGVTLLGRLNDQVVLHGCNPLYAAGDL
jgi:hypothetical protein